MDTQTIVFGGGCFWCTEAVFQDLMGVTGVMSGYAGGNVTNPTYEQICSGKTGHAEVIKIDYDPKRIKFHDLLTVFFATHDPTTMNRQGADVGTQYRSVIFYSTEAQKQEAEAFIKELGEGIVTQLEPLNNFYPAEEYHRNYYKNNSSAPYCQMVINPKLQKVQEKFYELLKK